jgi:hypothetical protein
MKLDVTPTQLETILDALNYTVEDRRDRAQDMRSDPYLPNPLAADWLDKKAQEAEDLRQDLTVTIMENKGAIK